MRLAVLVLPLLLSACVDPADDTATTAPAPLTGVDGSHDSADRACNVVLRSLDKTGTGTWTGTVEISAAAATEGLAPNVMWQRVGVNGAAWNVAATTLVSDGSATPGYAKYAVTINHDTGNGFQLVPYLAMSGGGRLFDHNRNAGDVDNYKVTAPDFAVWGAPSVCAAPTASDHATLTFHPDFTQTQDGIITAGGSLTVAYDWHRLGGCHFDQGGHHMWSITAHLRFDSGEEMAADVIDNPATFTVPTDGATTVAIWFESVNVSGCHEFDSSFGANYNFQLARAPQWLGLAQSLITRDSSSPCAGGSDAASGMSFDTWARQRAAVANLCFQAYQPGETDVPNDDLWKQLDARVHYRYVAGSASTAWQTASVNLAGRAGNNALYAWPWRQVDPFRDFHCPEVAPTATADNMYMQIGVEYWIDVNGGEIRPEPGAAFSGTFVDYPTNSWRAGNCP